MHKGIRCRGKGEIGVELFLWERRRRCSGCGVAGARVRGKPRAVRIFIFAFFLEKILTRGKMYIVHDRLRFILKSKG